MFDPFVLQFHLVLVRRENCSEIGPSWPYTQGPTFVQVQAFMSVHESQLFLTILSLAVAVDPKSYEMIFFPLSQMAFIKKAKEPKANSSRKKKKKCVETTGDPNFLCLHCAVGLRKPLEAGEPSSQQEVSLTSVLGHFPFSMASVVLLM